MKIWCLCCAAALFLLSGCAGLNDALVRAWMKDQQLGDRVGTQIREGLERRKAAPPPVHPLPAPEFLDQG